MSMKRSLKLAVTRLKTLKEKQYLDETHIKNPPLSQLLKLLDNLDDHSNVIVHTVVQTQSL